MVRTGGVSPESSSAGTQSFGGGFLGFFSTDRKKWREGQKTRDSVAVLEGCSERVSALNSLILGKIQGIYVESRLPAMHQPNETPDFLGEFPAIGTGNFLSPHGKARRLTANWECPFGDSKP